MTAVNQQAKRLEKANDPLGAVQTLEKGFAFLSGITRTASLQKKSEILQRSPQYKHLMKQKRDAMALEMRLQQGYLAALRDKDTLWWKNEINGLNEKISRPDNESMRLVYHRIKNFISTAAYGFCNTALIQHDLIHAENYISVYQIVDPGNPDGYYFKALFLSRSGQVKAARDCFYKAISLGFTDYKKAQAELPEVVLTVADQSLQ